MRNQVSNQTKAAVANAIQAEREMPLSDKLAGMLADHGIQDVVRELAGVIREDSYNAKWNYKFADFSLEAALELDKAALAILRLERRTFVCAGAKAKQDDIEAFSRL